MSIEKQTARIENLLDRIETKDPDDIPKALLGRLSDRLDDLAEAYENGSTAADARVLKRLETLAESVLTDFSSRLPDKILDTLDLVESSVLLDIRKGIRLIEKIEDGGFSDVSNADSKRLLNALESVIEYYDDTETSSGQDRIVKRLEKLTESATEDLSEKVASRLADTLSLLEDPIRIDLRTSLNIIERIESDGIESLSARAISRLTESANAISEYIEENGLIELSGTDLEQLVSLARSLSATFTSIEGSDSASTLLDSLSLLGESLRFNDNVIGNNAAILLTDDAESTVNFLYVNPIEFFNGGRASDIHIDIALDNVDGITTASDTADTLSDDESDNTDSVSDVTVDDTRVSDNVIGNNTAILATDNAKNTVNFIYINPIEFFNQGRGGDIYLNITVSGDDGTSSL